MPPLGIFSPGSGERSLGLSKGRSPWIFRPGLIDGRELRKVFGIHGRFLINKTEARGGTRNN